MGFLGGRVRVLSLGYSCCVSVLCWTRGIPHLFSVCICLVYCGVWMQSTSCSCASYA